MKTFKVINPAEFSEFYKWPSEGVVLDIREVEEHNKCQLKIEHENIPLDELNPSDFLKRHGFGKDTPIYIICHLGIRSRRAARKFVNEGFSHVFVVNGGIDTCINAGYEVEGKIDIQKGPFYVIGAFGFGEFCKLVPKDGIIIDVQAEIEHKECHLKIEHENIPLDKLNPRDFLKRNSFDKNIPICIMSRSSISSQQAAEKLINEGFSSVFIVNGGINACINAGHAVEGVLSHL